MTLPEEDNWPEGFVTSFMVSYSFLMGGLIRVFREGHRQALSPNAVIEGVTMFILK